MKSKLAEQAKRALVEATQAMSPEERLNAFLEHCMLMADLQEAGRRLEPGPERGPG